MYTTTPLSEYATPLQRTPDRAVVPRRGLSLTLYEQQYSKCPLRPASYDDNCTHATTTRDPIGGCGQSELREKHLPVLAPNLSLARQCAHRSRQFLARLATAIDAGEGCPWENDRRCAHREAPPYHPRPHGDDFEKTESSTRTMPSARSTSPSTDTG